MNEPRPYYALNDYFRAIFGCRVHKIPIDAGFSCPNRDGSISTGGCIYCNSYGSGTDAFRRGISIREQMESIKPVLQRKYGARKFMAYFQSFSNTYGPFDVLKQRYEEALADKDIVGLAVGTRPDCVNRKVLDLLASYQDRYVVWLEYGLQSAHDRTLARINRGHGVKDFLQAMKITQEIKLPVCVHIILGLPGESKNDVCETARFLADMKISGLKIHALYVVKGSYMEKIFRSGEYSPLGQEEYVDLVCDILEIIPADVVIHRLTGDPRPQELVAPLWVREKTATLNAIKAVLTTRGSYQGRFFGNGF